MHTVQRDLCFVLIGCRHSELFIANCSSCDVNVTVSLHVFGTAVQFSSIRAL